MKQLCSVSLSVLVVGVGVVATLGAPAASAQYVYEAYLEVPENKIYQGMGQWDADNDEYLAALATYGSPPYPGHEMIVINIPPTENAGDRPFDVEAAAEMLTALEAMAEDGRVPIVAVSYNDYTPAGGSGFTDWTAHDDEVTHSSGTTNQAMENQLVRAGGMLADFGQPIFVRIGLEFNNVTISSKSEGYHAYAFPICYQRTADIFEAQGVVRASYIWCWQASGPTDYLDVHPTTSAYKWYPGDDYVDWFGLDIFNRNEFTTLSSPITAAGSKLANVEAFLDEAEAKNVPVFIAESSCVDFPIAESATDDNDSWDEWFVHYFDFIEAHPNIQAFNYISHDWTGGSGGPDNWLDGTLANCDEVMDNWVAKLQEPQFLGAGSETLLNGYDGWWGLGNDLAGAGGRPHCAGAGIVLPDAHVAVVLSGAAASKPSGLFIGYSAIYSSFKGGVLVPSPDVVVPFTTSGSGGYSFIFDWPDIAVTGDTIWFQYWIKEQVGPPEVWAASNAIKGVTL